MIEYLGRQIPDEDAAFTDLVRREAHRSVTWDYSSDRPPGALDWVSGLAHAHPELLDRIEAAYAQLLAGGDPIEVREVLEQAIEHGHPERFARLLYDAVAQHAVRLREASDTTRDGRSLLGAAVAKVAELGQTPVPGKAATVLASVRAPSDGWPTSARLAFVGTPDANAGLLRQALADLEGEEFDDFVAGLVNLDDALRDRAFDEIGRTAPQTLRERVGEAAKAFLERAEESRQLLISSGALDKYSPDVRQRLTRPRADRWPELAARLRLAG